MFGGKTRDEFFFRTLQEHAQLSVQAADAMQRLLADPHADADAVLRTVTEVDDCEHQADALIRKLVRGLRETWIVPFDREDLRRLAHSLDDVLDGLDACANRLKMFELHGTRPHLLELAQTVQQACGKLAEAFELLPGLKRSDALLALCRQIAKLESVADSHYRDGIAQLYREERDPVVILKWSQVFEFLEEAADSAHDVADALEGIVLEYA